MAKQEYICYLPDKEGALETRMKVRPQHLSDVKSHVDRGFVVFGGATLDEPLKEGQGPKINGSVMLANADSIEDVWTWIKNDIYYTSGVWHAEKIQVIPFKSAIREAL